MSKKQDIAMAYAVNKRSAKKMAKGGKVQSDMDHGGKRGPEGYDKYQEQAQNQKGIHTPVSGVTGFPGGKGTSNAGSLAKDRYDGKAILTDAAKREHAKKLKEMQDAPKPNIKGLAEGGRVQAMPKARPAMVEGSLKVRSREEADAEEMGPAKQYEEQYHEPQKMAKGGMPKETEDRPDTGWGAIIFKGEGGEVKKSEAVPAPQASKQVSEQPPEQQVLDYKQLRKQYIEKNRLNRKRYAEGGEVELEDEASMAAAIMSKRRRMAEGGMVDIEENNEEQPNAIDDLNEDALLKENYDSDLLDLEEPLDSDLIGDPREMEQEDIHDEDTVSAIRRRMKSRSPITR